MSQRSFVLPIAKALHLKEAVQTLEYSVDGQLIATTDEGFSLRLWSGTSGVAVKKPSLLRQGVHFHDWLTPQGYISISAEHHRSGEYFHIRQGALYVTMVSDLAGGTFKTKQTSTIHLSGKEKRFNEAVSYPQACQERNSILGVAWREGSVPALIDLRTGQEQARISLHSKYRPAPLSDPGGCGCTRGPNV